MIQAYNLLKLRSLCCYFLMMIEWELWKYCVGNVGSFIIWVLFGWSLFLVAGNMLVVVYRVTKCNAQIQTEILNMSEIKLFSWCIKVKGGQCLPSP